MTAAPTALWCGSRIALAIERDQSATGRRVPGPPGASGAADTSEQPEGAPLKASVGQLSFGSVGRRSATHAS